MRTHSAPRHLLLILGVLALLAAAGMAAASPSEAATGKGQAFPVIDGQRTQMVRLSGPTRHVEHRRIVRVVHHTPAPTARRGYVEARLNNGALYRLRPCKQEDSRNCYWDAEFRGNGAGHSFADIRGSVVYLARWGTVSYY